MWPFPCVSSTSTKPRVKPDAPRHRSSGTPRCRRATPRAPAPAVCANRLSARRRERGRSGYETPHNGPKAQTELRWEKVATLSVDVDIAKMGLAIRRGVDAQASHRDPRNNRSVDKLGRTSGHTGVPENACSRDRHSRGRRVPAVKVCFLGGLTPVACSAE
jgi:hypothetical protein